MRPWGAERSPQASRRVEPSRTIRRRRCFGRRCGLAHQSDIYRIDLGGRLRPGANTITVTVSTTLYNAVKAAGGATHRLPEQRTGLLGPVVLTPYTESTLR
ncbi:hypothetical protein GCM10022214_12470 [Actinomadura miaoliensis]|uniref:Uncharacterized protein n=1 Tax=Actinomadura miaoliensis TaxID=430685 RepID=A0ABP7V7U0_9ACTN